MTEINSLTETDRYEDSQNDHAGKLHTNRRKITGNNIILIGMPASGKSSVGVILAKILGKGFVDTDLVIQQKENALLREIIANEGIDGFLKCEENAVLSIHPNNSVIATGGSVIYSEKAMEYLAGSGIIVYLYVKKEDLFTRLRNIQQRGVILKDGESLDEMYNSRSVLYEKYADVIINEQDLSLENTVQFIVKELQKSNSPSS